MIFSTISSFFLRITKTVILGTAQGVGFYIGIIGMKRMKLLSSSSSFWSSLLLGANEDIRKDKMDDDDSPNEKHQTENDIEVRDVPLPVIPSSLLPTVMVPQDQGINSLISSRSGSIGNEAEAHGGGGGSVSSTSGGKYLEMLVHNVAHTDLILSLGTSKTNNNARSENTIAQDNAPNKDDSTSSPVRNSPYDYRRIDDTTTPHQDHDLILCRPRFSAFDIFSRRIHQELQNSSKNDVDIISFPRYERSYATPRYSLITPRPSRQMMLPVGFDLGDNVKVCKMELPSLRIRGRDVEKVKGLDLVMRKHQRHLEEERVCGNVPHVDFETDDNNSEKDDLFVNAVFFPLLSTLMPRWEQTIAEKFDNSKRRVKKVVILVSGVGTPRNFTHSILGNSTKCCAELMEMYLKRLYPDVTVVRIHSDTNIFRYDENITFAKRELMPCIDAYRDAHARNEPYPDEIIPSETNDWTFFAPTTQNQFNPDWKQSFHVTLSFADGSPARTHAIQTSLRPYRPTYFHVWQLKTFWHETKISDEDIEVHSFEDMETVPAIDVRKAADDRVKLVVEEIKRFKENFMESMRRRNDVRGFWLRKTKKPVLAVLLVEMHGGLKPILYRGTNMEVSMPTGSLCAERNVIGTALAMNPGLKREDLKMVAVLALPLPTEEECASSSSVDGKSQEKLLTEVGEKLDQVKSARECGTMRRTASYASCASIVQETVEEEQHDDDTTLESSWVYNVPTIEGLGSSSVHKVDETKSNHDTGSSPKIPPLNLGTINNCSSPPGTPVRRINLYTNSDAENVAAGERGHKQGKSKPAMGDGGRRQKRTVIVHSTQDINPLRPCGACNEWLKKLAECNPSFKVLTFTDADCNGVYINSCQE